MYVRFKCLSPILFFGRYVLGFFAGSELCF